MVMANFRQKCEACLEASGGAFEFSLDWLANVLANVHMPLVTTFFIYSMKYIFIWLINQYFWSNGDNHRVFNIKTWILEQSFWRCLGCFGLFVPLNCLLSTIQTSKCNELLYRYIYNWQRTIVSEINQNPVMSSTKGSLN